jgi:predicted dehydrogenase
MAKKLGAAVVGLRMGRAHCQGYAALDGIALQAVCDLNEELARQTAFEFGAPVATAHFEDLLQDTDIRFVSIVTPDHFHADMTVAALAAGKDVLCEKPMAPTAEEIRRMVKAAEESGRALMVGQSYRFQGRYLAVKQAVERGDVGEVYFVASDYWNNLMGVGGVGNWRNDPRIRHPFVGGCHAVDLLRWIAGDVLEVSARANHKAFKEQPTEDFIMASMLFASGAVGRAIVSSGCRRPFHTSLEVHGTEGSIIDGKLWKSTHDTEPVNLPVPQVSQEVIGETRAFVEAVLARKPLPVDARDGALSTLVALAVVECLRTGQPMRIDRDALTYEPARG